MPEASFEETYIRLQNLFQAGEYAEALEAATEAVQIYPEQRTVLDYWRMGMSARLGDADLALEILRQAVERGQWYSEVLLRRSPSFKSLQSLPVFEELVARNQIMAEQDPATQYPIYTLRPEKRCQAGGPPCPLLIGLHSNMGTVYSSMGFWKPAAANGYLVAALQSSQALWKGAYVWDDRDLTERDVKHAYANLEENYAVDSRRLILGGHSLGGEMAIWLAIKGAVPAAGFLAIGPGGPWIDNLEQWQPLLREHTPTSLRGYIIAGEQDLSIPHENIETLVEWLNRAGISCELEIVPGLEHDHTPEYDPAVQRGLNFIME